MRDESLLFGIGAFATVAGDADVVPLTWPAARRLLEGGGAAVRRAALVLLEIGGEALDALLEH